MTPFEEIVGHRAALDLLRRMLLTGRVPHALLFEGPADVGKATVARTFAAGLLCEGAEVPCGRCRACRLVAAGGHPDLFPVRLLPKSTDDPAAAPAASPEEARKFLLVGQIREVARFAGIAPRLDRRRVFLIDPADRMMLAAQNALLKTLEEPPATVVLLLIADRPQVLLPTVRSRCFRLRFGPLPTSRLAAWLERRGVARGEALTRAALAEGRPGRALTLDAEARGRRRERVLGALETLSAPGAAAELPELAAALAGKSEIALVEGLDLLETLLRDAARAALDPGAGGVLIHADLAERVGPLGRRLGPSRSASLVRSVERLRAELRFNLNRTLVAESLLAAVAGGPLP